MLFKEMEREYFNYDTDITNIVTFPLIRGRETNINGSIIIQANLTVPPDIDLDLDDIL